MSGKQEYSDNKSKLYKSYLVQALKQMSLNPNPVLPTTMANVGPAVPPEAQMQAGMGEQNAGEAAKLEAQRKARAEMLR